MNQHEHRKSPRGVCIDLKVGEGVVLDMTAGDALSLNPSVDIRKITVSIEAKHGQRARVRVQAADSVRVGRPERQEA